MHPGRNRFLPHFYTKTDRFEAKFHYAIWFEPASNQLRTNERNGIWLSANLDLFLSVLGGRLGLVEALQ